MYISILDYSRESVTIIDDTEDVTKDMQTEDVETLLDVLGFKGSQISFMITSEDPYQPVSDYTTLRELCEDVDEDELEGLQHYLNITR